jgi:hypothetical protein
MNVSKQMDLLALRFGDAGGQEFPPAHRLGALNNAQDFLASQLDTSYLANLRTYEANNTVTAGVMSFSVLSNEVIKGREGILMVRVTNGRVATEIDIENMADTQNQYTAPSLTQPQYYISDNSINMLPASITAIDVLYLRKPTELLYEFTADVNGGGSTTTFVGAEGEGLVSTNDYYNDSVIYLVGRKKYHIITDFVASGLVFTVSPASATTIAGESFRFLSHGFDQTNLSGVTSDLSPELHPIMVTLAEAEGWAAAENASASTSAMNLAVAQIKAFNEMKTEAKGIGKHNR